MPCKKTISTCGDCGNEIMIRKRKNQEVYFCNTKCWYKYSKEHTERVENNCPVCEKTKTVTKAQFEYNKGHVCCSLKCAGVRERKRKIELCAYCGTDFEICVNGREKYCSRECYDLSQQRKTKIKCELCGKEFIKGKAAQERVKHNYCSKECFSKFNVAENSGMWKGGVSSVARRIRNGAKFKEWRNKVFTRDNYTCQKCGRRGGFLHPHHIKEFSQYPKLRFDINNGSTLCVECHGDIHNITYSQGSEEWKLSRIV